LKFARLKITNDPTRSQKSHRVTAAAPLR
jgi:hypothetical protein